MNLYMVTACWFDTEYERCIVVADTIDEARQIGILELDKNDVDVELLDITQKGIVRHI
jgi:hypothetical protein